MAKLKNKAQWGVSLLTSVTKGHEVYFSLAVFINICKHLQHE